MLGQSETVAKSVQGIHVSVTTSTSSRTVVDAGVETNYVNCPMCGRDEPRAYRPNMYSLGGVHFGLVRCPCGFVYITPRPDDASLARMYSDPAYYSDDYNLGVETESYFSRKDELLALYDKQIADLERIVGPPGDVLEIGSAGGFFLEAARRRGWRVKGVEISAPAVEYARREFGHDIFAGDLFNAPFPDESFDLVVADNVLEHTTHPQRFLEKLRSLVRPGGKLYVVVPSYVNSPYFRLLQAVRRLVPRRFLGAQLVKILKLDPDADPRGGGNPYHILEFNQPTLAGLIERSGFDLQWRQASVPLPSVLFKSGASNVRVRLLRAAFLILDAAMRAGMLPGARISVVARKR